MVGYRQKQKRRRAELDESMQHSRLAEFLVTTLLAKLG
jgi:hypothetical protein